MFFSPAPHFQAEKKGCVSPEDQKRKSEVEYLIKTKPMSFDQTNVIYEVDYQGAEVVAGENELSNFVR